MKGPLYYYQGRWLGAKIETTDESKPAVVGDGLYIYANNTATMLVSKTPGDVYYHNLSNLTCSKFGDWKLRQVSVYVPCEDILPLRKSDTVYYTNTSDPPAYVGCSKDVFARFSPASDYVSFFFPAPVATGSYLQYIQDVREWHPIISGLGSQ